MIPSFSNREAPSVPHVQWSAMTHTGKVRKNNEDAFLCIALEDQAFHYLGKEGDARGDSRDFIFAVSDGMGGANAGEFASRIAVEKITRLLPKGYRSMASGLSAGFADLFEELYEEINKALNYLGSQYEECAGMGATLTLVWIVPGWLFFAHIGDSRLYYLPAAGGLKQLSEDHSHVGWLRRQGKINEREARTHPMRFSLNRALGAGHQFVEPQVGSVGYEPGDLFLLCSDGITDGLWDRQILQLLRDPDAREQVLPPAPRLIEAALERSGRDNLTAFVFAFH
jgi:serine/threonine protein phosphatase PrpC